MLKRLLLAVVVGVVTALVVALVGLLLKAIHAEVAVTIGNFLENVSWLLGLLAGIWYYLTGQTPNQAV